MTYTELHTKFEELREKNLDLEATVEGLGQQNTELEKRVANAREDEAMLLGRVDALEEEIEQHKTRYRSAVRMIKNRQKELDLEKGARVRLARTYTALRQDLDKLLPSVEDLKNVNTNDLDDAIDELVGALSKLLNP